MAPAKKKPPVTGSRQLSDKGRPSKSTPQQRPTNVMPGPRPRTATRTSNTTGTPAPKSGVKVPAEWNAKTIYSGANKPRPGAPTTAAGRMAARGPLTAPGRGASPNLGLSRSVVKEMRASTTDVRPSNKSAAKPAGKITGQIAGTRAPKPAFGPVPNVKQTTLAQQRGQAAAQAAQGKRAARATSERMGAIVKGAQAARNVAGALKAGIRGGALAAGLQAYNTADGTLDAARKRGDYTPPKKVGPKKVGPKKVGPGKVGTIAQAFDKSFAAARKAGKSEFTFKGKKYNTKMK